MTQLEESGVTALGSRHKQKDYRAFLRMLLKLEPLESHWQKIGIGFWYPPSVLRN